MKKLIILVTLLFLIITSPKIIFGQEQRSSRESAVTKYNLAYPGILSDNPIYKLKVLRDKIIEFLISDPNKKVEFYLLQADKGISATAVLVDKNKIQLAEETALKAENNMTLITYELKKLKQEPNSELVGKLKIASLKHQEVLDSLISHLSKDKQSTLIKVLNFSKTNLQTIKNFEVNKLNN
jgi:hypothetical protein